MLKKILLFIFLILVNPDKASYFFLLLTNNDFISRVKNSTERMVFVENTNLESMPGVEILDSNNIYFQITKGEPNYIDLDLKRVINVSIKKSGTRVRMFHDQFKHIIVKLSCALMY